ncbi:MAG: Rieske 2Fe-2S domain-containing protein [Phycisphaerales bacterium]|nr:Rieske 2Fe-2S domain-containing protein [Phycisphaerales bacterium]
MIDNDKTETEKPADTTSDAPSSVFQPSMGVLPPRHMESIPPDGRPLDQQPPWRRDFPIDWARDHYVARRDFTKFLVLTSLAFVVGQFWIGALNFFRRRRGQLPMRRIATLATLPVGGSIGFKYPQEHDDCILVRPDEKTLVAYSQKCTHLACAVVPQCDRNQLHCPCHEGYFDLSSGRPIAGPPRRPLPKVNLEVRGDVIYATGIEWRMV